MEGVSRRASRSPALARSLARSVEWAGTREAPGGLGWRPSRKGSGRGQFSLRRRGDSAQPLKVGEGVPLRAPAAGEINKAAHGRAGGHPPPGQRGHWHCRSAPAPRPAAAPAAPASRAPRPPARPPRARGAWEVPGPPQSPGCSAARSPRSSPRPATSSSAGRAAPARTARLGSGLQLPRPQPAHPARPTAPLLSGRPPAEAPFAPTWPACPPSPGHCAHVRGRGHNPARIPRPGRERRSAPASERKSEPRGHTPPPAPLPSHRRRARARARGPRAPAGHARTRPPRTPTARRGYTPPAACRQWALNKCPSDSTRTCALEPDRVVTPPPTPTPKSEPAAAAPNQT